MQFSSWKSTMPFAYCTIAPGDGHAFRQPGSAQCMQPSLRISHSRSPFGFSYSAKRISVHEFSLRSCGFWYAPMFVPTSSRRSFHSMQATWQALQPMHLETSISLATSVVASARTFGDGVVVAERRMMSSDCSAMTVSYAFSTLTRNDLNSGVCELPSPTTGVKVLARKPALATPVKPQWIGMPTVCTVLPSIVSALMRLVTIATAVIELRFELTLTLLPLAMPS